MFPPADRTGFEFDATSAASEGRFVLIQFYWNPVAAARRIQLLCSRGEVNTFTVLSACLNVHYAIRCRSKEADWPPEHHADA